MSVIDYHYFSAFDSYNHRVCFDIEVQVKTNILDREYLFGPITVASELQLKYDRVLNAPLEIVFLASPETR